MAQKLTALPFFPSGLAHAGVGIKGVADKNPTAAVMTVGDKATSVKGIFQQQAKTVANLCAAARPDLTVRRNSVLPQEKSIPPRETESLSVRARLFSASPVVPNARILTSHPRIPSRPAG
jgi:hypothetical protein